VAIDVATGAGPAMTIGRGIRCAATRAAGRTALIAGPRCLSYTELVRRIARVAHMGRNHLRLAPGDRVALIAGNILEYIEIVAGLSDIGAIVATLSPRLTRAELADILADCSPRAIIIAADCLALLDDNSAIPVIVIGDDYEALLAAASDIPGHDGVAETAPFALAYTSGTTGRPKGVLLPHRSRAITFMAMAAEYRCFGVDDHFLALAPMCHGAGFVFACAALFFGGTTSLFPAGDPLAVLDRIARRDITGVFMVPTQFARLFDLPDTVLDSYRNHNLTSIISNAAALPQAMKERAVAQFGAGILHESYGSTEGGIVTNIRPADLLRKPGSVGLPFPGVEIAIRRPDGSIAAADEPGELFSRAPTSFAGYWNRPDETAETMIDGWVSVGDVAVADPDGFISIVDRKKDMVVSGGINVYPREIENVIARVPGVFESAVVGLPDAEWGERLHAFIVPSGTDTPSVTAIIAACRAQLAGFKIPRGISFITELPRNTGGKVMKRVLRDRGIQESES
jgi:acyl-CoA synthetase (AMP-forming)/AMP-acid ligase II